MIPYDYDQAGWGSVTRYDDWGGLAGLWVPDKFILHWGGNTRAPVEASIAWEMARLRSWQSYHMQGKVPGWRDIGYNAAVGQSGKIYRCRGDNPSGATSGDYEDDGIRENAEGFAVVWIGGKDTVGGPSEAAYDAYTRIIQSRPEYNVSGHMDVSPRLCPGRDIMRYIANEGWNIPPPPPVPTDEMFCKRGETSPIVMFYQNLLVLNGYEFSPPTEFFGGTMVLALKAMGFDGEQVGPDEASALHAGVAGVPLNVEYTQVVKDVS